MKKTKLQRENGDTEKAGCCISHQINIDEFLVSLLLILTV